jgi:hypothetical protein
MVKVTLEVLAKLKAKPRILRIPEQSCHLIQTKAATHSISKLPPIPVKSATPLKFKF